jgi:hypothetical protein
MKKTSKKPETKMAKANERMDDARRQGQFEGQVLTSLDSIKKGMDTFNTQFAGLEGRVRINENTLGSHTQLFKDSDGIHQELYNQIKNLAEIVTGIVTYQNRQRGVILAITVVTPIITTIIAAVILKAIY